MAFIYTDSTKSGLLYHNNRIVVLMNDCGDRTVSISRTIKEKHCYTSSLFKYGFRVKHLKQ